MFLPIKELKKLNLSIIKKQTEEIEKHPFFQKESEGYDVKITDINILFIEKFRPGYYRRSFIIDEQETQQDIKDGNTFIYNIPLYYRVLFYRYTGLLWVEECNPNGANPRGPGIFTFSDFIYKYWNPEGLYAIEGFLLKES